MITVAEQIRRLQQYAPDAIVADPADQILDPGNGSLAAPLFHWMPKSYRFKAGDRVRKPGYDDTGTVTVPEDMVPRPSMVCVRWDGTGDSYESVDLIGLAR